MWHYSLYYHHTQNSLTWMSISAFKVLYTHMTVPCKDILKLNLWQSTTLIEIDKWAKETRKSPIPWWENISTHTWPEPVKRYTGIKTKMILKENVNIKGNHERLDQKTFQGPFQPGLFYDLRTLKGCGSPTDGITLPLEVRNSSKQKAHPSCHGHFYHLQQLVQKASHTSSAEKGNFPLLN